MTPIELLRLVSEPLKKEECLFAVCGGIASGVYRTTFRTTNDLDIALLYPSHIVGKSEKEFAINFLERLGIKAKIGFIPGIAVQDESNVFLVVGEFGGFLPSLDFILPNLPWVKQSVTRAQNNLVDFGFGSLPTFSPEDLIISKAYALSIEPKRVQDRSDIDSILEGKAIREQAYLDENLSKLGLKIT